jgi:hypothetical protein
VLDGLVLGVEHCDVGKVGHGIEHIALAGRRETVVK